jgi:hypothetical protein
MNYYNSFKRVQLYKTQIFQCGNNLPTEDKTILKDKICYCVTSNLKEDDVKSARKVQQNYYNEMRKKYNLTGVFFCESRDARNDNVLRGLGDTSR